MAELPQGHEAISEESAAVYRRMKPIGSSIHATPRSENQQAILHPEEEVRLTAVSYFADSIAAIPQSCRWWIEAIETHGRIRRFAFFVTPNILFRPPPRLIRSSTNFVEISTPRTSTPTISDLPWAWSSSPPLWTFLEDGSGTLIA